MCPQGELHGHNWSSASVNLGELSLLDSLHEHDMDTTTPSTHLLNLYTLNTSGQKEKE